MHFTSNGERWQLRWRSEAAIPSDTAPPPGDAPSGPTWLQHTVTSHLEAIMLLRHLAGSGTSAMQLRAFLRPQDATAIHRRTDHEIVALAAHLLAIGDLALLHERRPRQLMPWVYRRAATEEAATPPAYTPANLSNRAANEEASAAQAVATHWIEIELVGEDDQPIAGEAYVVELPDGTRRSGRLDGDGFARIDGIQGGGSCKVSFPKLDQEAWQKLQALPARGSAPARPAPAPAAPVPA